MASSFRAVLLIVLMRFRSTRRYLSELESEDIPGREKARLPRHARFQLSLRVRSVPKHAKVVGTLWNVAFWLTKVVYQFQATSRYRVRYLLYSRVHHHPKITYRTFDHWWYKSIESHCPTNSHCIMCSMGKKYARCVTTALQLSKSPEG